MGTERENARQRPHGCHGSRAGGRVAGTGWNVGGTLTLWYKENESGNVMGHASLLINLLVSQILPKKGLLGKRNVWGWSWGTLG